MIKEARGFGADVLEAKENAIANLGAGIDEDIQFEVITSEKKKFLGLFGGRQAEVRVYVEVPDPKPKKDKKPAKKQNEKASKPEAKNEKIAKPEVDNKESTDTKTESVTVKDDYKDAVDEALIPANSKTAAAIKYLRTILAQLGCENITIKAAERENGAFIILDGEGLGVIIGHRGETLDALQYLASLVANNGGGYFKITLNIGNYREKREQTLIALANRVAAQVISSRRSRRLEPMNPYERRIIHNAVQDIEGVVSSSIGEGDRRRVVIFPEGGDMRPPRDDDRRGSKGGRGGRGGRERKSSNTVATTPTREPKKDSDMPLYGKIN